MESWRKPSNDASFAALNAHELESRLRKAHSHPPAACGAGCVRFPTGAGRGAEERLVVPTQIVVRRPGRDPHLVPVRWAARDWPKVRGWTGLGGPRARPARHRSGRPVAVLEASFAEHHDLSASGSLRLAGGGPIRYVGQGRRRNTSSSPDPAGASSAAPRRTSRSSSRRCRQRSARSRAAPW